MTSPPKVAMPWTAVAVAVLLPLANVPLLRVSVTVEESPVTVLPPASSTATATGGGRGEPATPLPGCCVKESFAGVWIVNALDVALVRPPSRAVRGEGAGALSARLAKVATPAETGAVAVLLPPTKVPLLSVSVTVELLSPVNVLPNWSRTDTVTAGVRATPVSPLVGCWVNARLVATGDPNGVTRVPLAVSDAASVMVTVLVRLDVPLGIVLLTSTEKTTEPVVPALRAPTANV